MDFLTNIGSAIMPFIDNLISPVSEKIGSVAGGLVNQYAPEIKKGLCDCDKEAEQAAEEYKKSLPRDIPIRNETYGHVEINGQRHYKPRTIKHLQKNIRR